MESLLIHHIGQLAGIRSQSRPLKGNCLSDFLCLENAWMLIREGRIAAFGSMEEDWRAGAHAGVGVHVIAGSMGSPGSDVHTGGSIREIDAGGALVLPAWCDSHTHIVFAGSREQEFVDKIKGVSYAEIAAKGGGILNSARKLADTPEEDLYYMAYARLVECMRMGTGAIEIKSGYGLSTEAELKMLRVIQRLKQNAPIPVRSTFLGAHAFPVAFKNNRDAYIDLVVEEMLPQIQAEGLADYIDVFCEDGFFTQSETERICRAGMERGLIPKIHANQLNRSGGVQAGVAVGALSVDHLETMGPEEIACLQGSTTIATLLPGAAFFLRMGYPPARAMVDAGLTLALASDYNPGSCPSGNMNFVVALACIQMKLTPEEAINAATINGAYAMGVGQEVGSITEGKKANLIFMRPVPSLAYLPYAFGTTHIDRVMINGEFLDY